jgi:hypothetical protein
MQPGKESVEPVAHVAHSPELARKVGQRSVQLAERAAELVRARQSPGRIVVDEFPERHPETLMLERPRCKDIAG